MRRDEFSHLDKFLISVSTGIPELQFVITLDIKRLKMAFIGFTKCCLPAIKKNKPLLYFVNIIHLGRRLILYVPNFC